jgi:LPXTG-motif cell wall-anchored protein
MKLGTKKKLGRKFASLLCVSLIGVHLSQAAYASDEIVYQWYTNDMRTAVNNVTKDECHNVKDLFEGTNLDELREYLKNTDGLQDLTEYFEDSDVLYELGIEDDTMSAHLLATGDMDSITEDNAYKLAENDWLIIYLSYANPEDTTEDTASIMLDEDEIVNVPLYPADYYLAVRVQILDWKVIPNQPIILSKESANNNLSINIIDATAAESATESAAETEESESAAESAAETEESESAAESAAEAEESESAAESAAETEESESAAESAAEAKESESAAESAAETEESESAAESAAETEESESAAESAAETEESESTDESANNTDSHNGITYEVTDFQEDNSQVEDFTSSESEKVALSISHHDVPLLAESNDNDENIGTDDETEPDYELTINGSWYDLVTDGIVIGIPVKGILSDDDDDNTAAPTGINTTNEYDEPADTETTAAEPANEETTAAEPADAETTAAEPADAETTAAEPADAETTAAEPTAAEPTSAETTAVETTAAETTAPEKTRSGGGGGGSNSGDSDSTPSGTTAASTEATKTTEQTTEAESKTSEIPEKSFYPELPDIPGNPDGTPDIPEGTEVEIYDLNNSAEPVYRGAYSDNIDLPAGRYEIVVLDDEGVPLASGIFTIDEEGVARGALPKTGDTSIPFVLLALLMAGATVSAGVLVIRIRKIDE